MRILVNCLLSAVLCPVAAQAAPVPAVRFVPQPALKITGFWADRLDRLERCWIPHCWDRLGVKGGVFQRNLAEATMLALERHPERQDLAVILERFVQADIARQQPDGYVGRCNPHYADYARHELYGQGYFIEAAVRHVAFTKGRDRRYFDAAIRLADHLDAVFGPPPKRTWTDGALGTGPAKACIFKHFALSGSSAAIPAPPPGGPFPACSAAFEILTIS